MPCRIMSRITSQTHCQMVSQMIPWMVTEMTSGIMYNIPSWMVNQMPCQALCQVEMNAAVYKLGLCKASKWSYNSVRVSRMTSWTGAKDDQLDAKLDGEPDNPLHQHPQATHDPVQAHGNTSRLDSTQSRQSQNNMTVNIGPQENNPPPEVPNNVTVPNQPTRPPPTRK